MTLRVHVADPLVGGLSIRLQDAAARHVQVRRLQPGSALTLFDGRGGEWACRIERMGRSSVDVLVGQHDPADRGVQVPLEIAMGMPANERMDALIEKATELGAAAIHPLQTHHSVLRLDGERAARRVSHWRAVAVAASEQCGRTRVPAVGAVLTLDGWLAAIPDALDGRVLLSPADAVPLGDHIAARPRARIWAALSGPEGGLTIEEQQMARSAGFHSATLGPLVLRADTAPLAFLAQMVALMPRTGA